MTRYHPVSVALHWVLALAIIMLLYAGTNWLVPVPNSDPNKVTDGFRPHMILGMTVLILMIVRLVMRFFTTAPAHVDTGNALINFGGKAAHWILYLLVFGMCLSGLATANMAGLPDIVFFGSDAAVPANFDDIPPRAAHGVIAKLLMLFIALHAAAAIWHHFIRGDGLLSRMWFGKRS